MKKVLRIVTVFGLMAGHPEGSPCAGGSDLRGSGAVLSLSGSDWMIHEDAEGADARYAVARPEPATGWIPATVPGNIQADLEAAKLMAPIFYGVGDPRLEEVAHKDWWYRKDFKVPASFAGRRVQLVFDGADHECEVFLDGKPLGTHAGMYRRFAFDVEVRPGKTHRLAVRIVRMPKQLWDCIAVADRPGGAGVPAAVDRTRDLLKDMKMPANYAWDWSIAVYTLGLWKEVRLEASGPAKIEWVRVQTRLSNNYAQAAVLASLEIDSLVEANVRAELSLEGQGSAAGTSVEAALKRGRNHLRAEIPLDRPRLWWPHTHGAQPLYCLRSRLVDAQSRQLLDENRTRFGVREIRWEQTPGTPKDFPNPFRLLVNGRPIRMRGSNLLPPDLLPGRIRENGPRVLDLAKAAGLNAMRIWGGGIVFAPEMYDRADELGLLLMQEFILCNSNPAPEPVFMATIRETQINIIKQLRNHPSLVEWTGGNEMSWPLDNKVLQQMLATEREFDDRIMRPQEPAAGSGPHGTYTYVYHTRPMPQLSWLGAGNGPRPHNLYTVYNAANNIMRLSEFGTNSMAHLETWQRDIPPASQWPLRDPPNDPTLVRKNAYYGAALPQNWMHKEITGELFGALDDLAPMIEASQFLGAEGLRYAMDELRRKGEQLGGGYMSWDFNEPWRNAAGSFMVDYDGRPLMNYDFVKQANAPISLGLRYDSLLYAVSQGLRADLFLVSDAPAPASNLRWRWLARDRRGAVFARDEGSASIQPLQALKVASLDLVPPAGISFGPLLVELQLLDAEGRLLAERIHIFGASDFNGSLSGLLKNRSGDADDDPAPLAANVVGGREGPDAPANLAFVGNGARPATASSERDEPIHKAAGINDGKYGNGHSWIGRTPRSWFQIDLGKVTTVGRLKLGRDRTGQYADRLADEVKVETSRDQQAWETAFEQRGITALPGFQPTGDTGILIRPVEARYVRVTVNVEDASNGAYACVDECEVYGPSSREEGPLPRVVFPEGRTVLYRPVTRTRLEVIPSPPRIANNEEVLDLRVRNTGQMTALFLEPHPLIEYRTDLFIENNHCFIPPGESRTITIKAAKTPRGGLTLGQTGWRLTTWNADDVVIEPSHEVLLSLGRRDQMCREFAGHSDPGKDANAGPVSIEGSRPDPSQVPYLLDGKTAVRFEFALSDVQAKRPARLRIHTADQAEKAPTRVVVTMNGRRIEGSLPLGLGIQRTDPAHLAFPATVEFQIPARDLRPGKNALEVRIKGDGWFSWDAMDLTSHN